MDQTKSIIAIYTGNGKGKTTAAVGQIIRVCGAGWRVGLIRWLKDETSSEMAVLQQIPGLTIKTASPGFKGFFSDLPAARQQTIVEESLAALALAEEWLKKGDLNLLVLDELMVAVDFKIITQERVIHLFNLARDKAVDLVVTGRGSNTEIFKAADLITEMKEVKHPYTSGYPARRGYDY
ncbi:MAG: cob(I)yrinic acid a,c-diamide adenosyltransferase [Methylocystaceae bacterium]